MNFRWMRIVESKPTVDYVDEIEIDAAGLESADASNTLQSFAGIFKPHEISIAHLKQEQIERDNDGQQQIQQEGQNQGSQKRALPRGSHS